MAKRRTRTELVRELAEAQERLEMIGKLHSITIVFGNDGELVQLANSPFTPPDMVAAKRALINTGAQIDGMLMQMQAQAQAQAREREGDGEQVVTGG